MRWIRQAAMAAALASSVAGGAWATGIGWPQWGGPTRDFKADSRGLAASWPASGPKELWSRPLGEGYSGIAVENGVLYTQYRPVKGFFSTMVSRFTGSQPEVVTAIDAASGKTLWEHVYEAPILSGMDTGYGPGPNATPLVAGDLVFAVGSTGKLHALDKKTGRVVWKKDLGGEMGGQVHGRGYAPSPLAHGATVILPVGGAGQALVAFKQKDGEVAWKNHTFDIAPASPPPLPLGGGGSGGRFPRGG